MPRIRFDWRKTHSGSLPLKQSCDPHNPRQALLWMFTGVGVRGAPIPLPVEYYEELSAHIVECLGIPLDEHGRLLEPIGASLGWSPRRKYVPPVSVMNRAAAAGEWVTIDEPDPVRQSIADVLANMTVADQNAVKDAVLQRIGLSEVDAADLAPDSVPVGRVAKLCGLTTAQIVTVLAGWGMEVTGRSWIDRGTALRVVAHYRRVAT